MGDDQRELAAAPDVWSDGSLVLDELSGVGVGGCGVYAHASGAAWFGRRWGHLDLLLPLPDGTGEAGRLCCSIPGPFQTVQRAEIWGVSVQIRASTAVVFFFANLAFLTLISAVVKS